MKYAYMYSELEIGECNWIIFDYPCGLPFLWREECEGNTVLQHAQCRLRLERVYSHVSKYWYDYYRYYMYTPCTLECIIVGNWL